jgi:hypothetical protein
MTKCQRKRLIVSGQPPSTRPEFELGSNGLIALCMFGTFSLPRTGDPLIATVRLEYYPDVNIGDNGNGEANREIFYKKGKSMIQEPRYNSFFPKLMAVTRTFA